MIHDSVLPPEQVFQGMDEFKPAYMMLHVDGCQMEVEAIDATRARIVRLYSPNPQHYLNTSLAPGAIINLQFGSE